MKARLAALALAVLVAGCAGTPGDQTDDGWRAEGGYVWTKKVSIAGTPCILATITSDSVSISCDWSGE